MFGRVSDCTDSERPSMQSSRRDVHPPKHLNIALPSPATYITVYCTNFAKDFEDSRLLYLSVHYCRT
jgi:hypothetical protein